LADGTAIVHESADGQRRFQPDSRTANSYFAANGDTGRLRKVPGVGFELTELDGTLTRFRADGRFDQVRDPSGNTITAGYTAGLITSLSHSSGGSLAIVYNTAGRITSITDSFGRVTSYTYDPANEHLLTVTDPSGTTTYTYSTGQGAAREHALTSITDPGGVMRYFDYDDRGRLIETHVDGNLEQTTFDYGNEGQVTITDREGVATELFFNGNGFLARTEDASGFYVRSNFDERLRLIQTVDAIGRSESYSWTRAGAFESITDALNQRTLFTPSGPLNLPQSFTDARGNVTSYAYDAVGNLVATTYPDATIERTTFDPFGNADLVTNRRGQTIDRTVNAAGQVTHETRSDGTFADYTYDTRGRLKTAADASGTITLTYDTADRLTRVEYPGGRFLQ
jgi:YD repeat-containing protein